MYLEPAWFVILYRLSIQYIYTRVCFSCTAFSFLGVFFPSDLQALIIAESIMFSFIDSSMGFEHVTAGIVDVCRRLTGDTRVSS